MYESTFWTPFGFLKTYLLVAWILSDCFEPSVFSSQQYLNRPAINAVQWRHHYPKTGQWFWLVDCLNICIIMYNYGKFLRDCQLIFIGLHWWHACIMSSNISLIFIVNSKIPLVFGTELLNWTAYEEPLCCCHSDFVNAKFLRLMSCCHSTFLLISLSSVMILLAFLSCFFVFFFLC